LGALEKLDCLFIVHADSVSTKTDTAAKVSIIKRFHEFITELRRRFSHPGLVVDREKFNKNEVWMILLEEMRISSNNIALKRFHVNFPENHFAIIPPWAFFLMRVAPIFRTLYLTIETFSI
jgi:hypothetical protein